MDLALRRALPALCLLCVTCASGVLALSLKSLVEAWLRPPPPPVEAVLREPPARREELPTPLALVPLRRYLGLPDKLRQEVIPAPGDAADIRPRTDLRLLGTMLGAYSLASVWESTPQRTRSVRLGGEFDGAEVIVIERTRVLLSREGKLEAIVAQPASAPLPTAARPPEPDASIRQVGPSAYEITRQELTHSLANINELVTQARVVPVFQDGVATGFRLFALRPNSLFTRLGLRDRDVVRRINGLELNSVERALEVFSRLRDASRFEVEGERDGQALRSTYTVRG